MSHCVDNNIFSERDRGGYILQLLKVLDNWTKAIDNVLHVDSLYLDLQTTFNSVHHKRHILKLE